MSDFFQTAETNNETGKVRYNKLHTLANGDFSDSLVEDLRDRMGANDIKVKVSADDMETNYLDNKIGVKDKIVKEIYTDGNGKQRIDLGIDLEHLIHSGMGWKVETSTTIIRPDLTEFELRSDYINFETSGSYVNNVYHILGLSQGGGGNIGTLKSLGSNQTMTPELWQAIDGLVFILQAPFSGYFNIKVNSTAITTNHKSIKGVQDIYFLESAAFVFDAKLMQWLLLSYTHHRWARQYVFGTISPNIWANICTLPAYGYYRVSATINVKELITANPDIYANLDSVQIFQCRTGYETRVLDKSVFHIPAQGTITKVCSIFLRGSTIIKANEGSSLDFDIIALLQNGGIRSISGGTVEINYLSRLSGT